MNKDDKMLKEDAAAVESLLEAIGKERQSLLKIIATQMNKLNDSMRAMDFDKGAELCAELLLHIGAFTPVNNLANDIMKELKNMNHSLSSIN